MIMGCKKLDDTEYYEIDPNYINFVDSTESDVVEKDESIKTQNIGNEDDFDGQEIQGIEDQKDENEEIVDLDLSAFNSNLLYAEVCNMTITPEEYDGKIIKIIGEFIDVPKEYDENGNAKTEERRYYCLISDELACCSAGIELLPKNGTIESNEYLGSGSKIEVIGKCHIYNDETGFLTYVQLRNAKINKLKY